MIVNFKKAILHILDAEAGNALYSDAAIDTTRPEVAGYISNHIDKVYDDPGLRNGIFRESSGFLYHLKEYVSGETDFHKFSVNTAEKIYEAVKSSQKIHSFDLLICDCDISSRPAVVLLKFDSKPGYAHSIMHQNDGILNEIVNSCSILPSPSQKISECAFIFTDDYSIKYKGKRITINSESSDLIADLLLECDYDKSVKESFMTVQRIAKNIAKDYGGTGIEEAAKLKKYIKETAVPKECIEVKQLADTVFDTAPAARAEFSEKVKQAEIPESFDINEFVTKRVNKNVKLVTEKGIEISFPPEFYRDEDNIHISSNEDGTISISINNIGEIMSKL